MIRVACPTCQTKYRFDESQLGGKPRVTAKCKKCGGSIEIGAAEAEPATLPSLGEAGGPTPAPARERDTTARVRRLRSDEKLGEETITGHRVAEVLDLPQDKKYSLAVLQGKASGQIFQIRKVKTVLGRAAPTVSTIPVSRQHATLKSGLLVGPRPRQHQRHVRSGSVSIRRLENHNEFGSAKRADADSHRPRIARGRRRRNERRKEAKAPEETRRRKNTINGIRR
jgi:predicted Zn finger-like uncharacterized protein